MEKRYPSTILATACIPWTENFEFDEQLFRQEVSMLLENGIYNIYLFGTAGEGYAVNREQYVKIVKTFLNETEHNSDAQPMIGVISLSMSEIIERVAIGMELGAKDFQLSFPSWGAVTREEGMDFLRVVCNKFPGARFMHYNNGLRSKTRLAAKHYEILAYDLPNLVAVKNPGPGVYELQEFHGKGLPIQFFNLEYAYGFASMTEANAYLVSIGNLNFSIAKKYFKAGVHKDIETITACHSDFDLVNDALNALPQDMLDGAYDKLFIKPHIPDFPLRLYPPYKGLTDEQYSVFQETLKQTLPHWF